MKKLSELTVSHEIPTYAPGPNGPVLQGTHQRISRAPVKSINAGARFGHYILDAIVIYGIQTLIGKFMSPFLFSAIGESLNGLNGIMIIFVLVNVLSGYVYYFLMELLFQQTLGKMATQSVVVDEYGNKPSAWQVFLRTISRLVPFEAFSCLGTPSRGWHDRWAKTYVIRKSDLAELRRRLDEQDDENAVIYNSMVTDQDLKI